LTDPEPIQGRVHVVAKTTCYSWQNWKATHIFPSGTVRGAVVCFVLLFQSLCRTP